MFLQKSEVIFPFSGIKQIQLWHVYKYGYTLTKVPCHFSLQISECINEMNLKISANWKQLCNGTKTENPTFSCKYQGSG